MQSTLSRHYSFIVCFNIFLSFTLFFLRGPSVFSTETWHVLCTRIAAMCSTCSANLCYKGLHGTLFRRGSSNTYHFIFLHFAFVTADSFSERCLFFFFIGGIPIEIYIWRKCSCVVCMRLNAVSLCSVWWELRIRFAVCLVWTGCLWTPMYVHTRTWTLLGFAPQDRPADRALYHCCQRSSSRQSRTLHVHRFNKCVLHVRFSCELYKIIAGTEIVLIRWCL